MARCCVLSLLLLSVLVVFLGPAGALEVSQEMWEQVTGQLSSLEARNRRLEARGIVYGSVDRRQVTDGPIAFTARIDQHEIDHVQRRQTFVFDSVLTNVGNGYDNTTGIFTAPLSGIYMIACSMLDSFAHADMSGDRLNADIMLNGNTLARVFAHAEGTSYRDQGAQTVFVELKKGDQVWVQNRNNNDLSLGGDMYSTFSGYLMHQQ